MNSTTLWVLIGIVILAGAVVAWLIWSRQRTARLRRQFGPEYTRVVQEVGDIRRAESTLTARAKRVERLHIKPLTPGDRRRFGDMWRNVQTRFVDDPQGAVTDADRLVGETMHARGYPLGDFDQRADDISVDHPSVVMNYRAAREIAQRHSRGEANTEDLRQAMVHYRALFMDLLETHEPLTDEKTTPPEHEHARRA